MDFSREIELLVVVKPVYTLGGTGGGVAYSEDKYNKFKEKIKGDD